MSGVMIKLGIYGLVRVVFDFMSGGPAWWGGLLFAAGSASALLGVLYALMENDLKRLLAYSSVEEHRHHFHWLGRRLDPATIWSAGTGGAWVRGSALAHAESRLLQRAPIPGRRQRHAANPHPQYGANGRPHQANAVHGSLFSRRVGRHRGAATAERVRVGVARLSI